MYYFVSFRAVYLVKMSCHFLYWFWQNFCAKRLNFAGDFFHHIVQSQLQLIQLHRNLLLLLLSPLVYFYDFVSEVAIL